ncbi:MAG: hypothetical protein HQL31_04700, partial [Planctomycetes bacterium]|nr:hypothetical protein [Planctomycetota bacterium]
MSLMLSAAPQLRDCLVLDSRTGLRGKVRDRDFYEELMVSAYSYDEIDREDLSWQPGIKALGEWRFSRRFGEVSVYGARFRLQSSSGLRFVFSRGSGDLVHSHTPEFPASLPLLAELDSAAARP